MRFIVTAFFLFVSANAYARKVLPGEESTTFDFFSWNLAIATPLLIIFIVGFWGVFFNKQLSARLFGAIAIFFVITVVFLKEEIRSRFFQAQTVSELLEKKKF